MSADNAFPAFRERRWRDVRAACESSTDSLSRFFFTWAAFELNEPVSVELLRRAMADSMEWALHGMWGLWPFRKRVGVDRLLEWGVHDELVTRCWLAFREARGLSTFADEWVSHEL